MIVFILHTMVEQQTCILLILCLNLQEDNDICVYARLSHNNHVLIEIYQLNNYENSDRSGLSFKSLNIIDSAMSGEGACIDVTQKS